MSSFESLNEELENVLKRVFQTQSNECHRIYLTYASSDEEFIVYSLDDVLKYFWKEEVTKERVELLGASLSSKHKFRVKDIKAAHVVEPEMTIESYLNHQKLLSFTDDEMNDIYIDKIGLFELLILLQVPSVRIFKNFVFDVVLKAIDKPIKTKPELKDDLSSSLNEVRTDLKELKGALYSLLDEMNFTRTIKMKK